MIISHGLFFSDFHKYAMYCGIAWTQTFQVNVSIYHIPLLKLLYFTSENDAE